MGMNSTCSCEYGVRRQSVPDPLERARRTFGASMRKALLTIVLNSAYRVRYEMQDQKLLIVTSRSNTSAG
jgi:hypothetical protein